MHCVVLNILPLTNNVLIRVEENAGMVSGSEGPTGYLPELKALALNEAPPKSELTDRYDIIVLLFLICVWFGSMTGAYYDTLFSFMRSAYHSNMFDSSTSWKIPKKIMYVK